MTDVAIGQLVWLCIGLVIGLLGGYALPWIFPTKRTVDVKIDWNTIGPGVGSAMTEACKHIAVNRANITVDWTLVHDAIEGSGYTLVAKPDGSNTAHRH